jgi:hypothetical protein
MQALARTPVGGWLFINVFPAIDRWLMPFSGGRLKVAIEIGGTRIEVRARVAEGPERADVWRRVNDNYNGYDTYQRRAGDRVIPVVVLERT